ncbi:hypothetical protein D9Q98_004515 [Chlorella vulgaris]|uniref:CAAX prenyl protease 2/Lysostaphin resistance protein A-like domain-containing protein n=1 Tax=Chlorella vulgaris TaxID=3077 RepID=A0A9D4YXI2_CHLVU|nr:hypothetical protein D9Q98_004515 [Chlorella vulgaris]
MKGGSVVLQRAGAGLLAARHHRRQRVAAPPAAASGAKQKTKQPGGKGFGKLAGPAASIQEQQPADPGAAQPDAPPVVASTVAAAGTAESGSGVLPVVSKGQIIAVCTQVSVLVTVLAFGLRQVAPAIAPAVKDGQAAAVANLLQWAVLPSAGQVALAVGVAAGVTGARLALLAVWPDFRDASERSNQQVLAPLSAADVVLVGALPAVSEELLFRGALIPAVYPDWRGVVIAGLAFGVLHNSGGRNPAFAVWASVVGCAYGALFLATGTVACPVLAHSLSNIASAALWKSSTVGSGDGGSGGSSSSA